MAASVLVAMSGGVDSSVAAALLKQQGYDVIGITMQIMDDTQAVDDAKLVAERLGIPHHAFDIRKEFDELVIEYFVDEYRNGRTPNPCVKCNRLIKFGMLMNKARDLGAGYLATGHYARIEKIQEPNNKNQTMPKYQLLKGKDKTKDQSYVLYTLDQAALAHTIFPLGEMTKKEVRKKAEQLGLPSAGRKESQEICFIEDDDYARFLKERIPEYCKPGPILDASGKQVGAHDGILFYTIGQRKGIGAHNGRPKYVVSIDPEKNAVIIGDDSETLRSSLIARDVALTSGAALTGELEIKAKIRYNSPEVPAKVVPLGENEAKVAFIEPQRAVTPGQSVVFYSGDEVLGGGMIGQGGD